jgi:hypothetical protein
MMSRREAVSTLREDARNEAAELVRGVAGERGWSDTIQACIARAAQRLGWSYVRTEDIWRKQAKRIESFEMDQLRRFGAARRHMPAEIAVKPRDVAESSKKVRGRKPR